MKKNLFLFLTVLAVAVLGAELILRCLETPAERKPGPKTDWAVVPERVWTEYHPVLGWYHQKNKTAYFEKERWKIQVHTNSAGFRGTLEYRFEKPAGVRRAISLGDSFAFGWGVEDGETYGAVLEKQVPDLEVLNAGVAGYGLDQIYLSFREIGRFYQAEEAVIAIFPEDFWRATRAFSDSGYAKPYFTVTDSGKLTLRNVPVPRPFELKTGQFPSVIEYPAWRTFFRQSAFYRLLERAAFKLGKKAGWVDPDTTAEWELGKTILARLVTEVREAKMRPLFLLIPPERWVSSEQRISLYESFLKFAAKEKVEVIDFRRILKPLFRENGANRYYLENEGHWTAETHRLAAQLIGAYWKGKPAP
jgi:hypothetical protein